MSFACTSRALGLVTLSFTSLLLGLTACSPTNRIPGEGGSAGSGGGGGSGGETVLTETTGCDASVKLYAAPEDPGKRGPWPVGVRTVYEGGLPAEVLYPAMIGSEEGKEKVTYNLFDYIPDKFESQLDYASPPIQTGEAYRDLPIDDAHGPYPVILYVEGRYGMLTEAFSHLSHWASRGFVVVTVDMPGMKMADQITGSFSYNILQDQKNIITTLSGPAGDSAFLIGRLDMTRLALASHGENSLWIGNELPNVQVNVAWSPLCDSNYNLQPSGSILILGNTGDVFYNNYTKPCFDTLPGLRRFVAIGSSKGRIGDDLCWIRNAEDKGLPEVMIPFGLDKPQNMDVDLACTHGRPEEEIAPVIDFASTAVIEEKLMCRSAAMLDGIQQKYTQVNEYKNSAN